MSVVCEFYAGCFWFICGVGMVLVVCVWCEVGVCCMCFLCGIYNACLNCLHEVYVVVCVLCVVCVWHVCGGSVVMCFCVLRELCV